jgi:class 3 adenylate cyclase
MGAFYSLALSKRQRFLLIPQAEENFTGVLEVLYLVWGDWFGNVLLIFVIMSFSAAASSSPRANSLLNESWRYLMAEYATRIWLLTLTLFGLSFWWTSWPDEETRHILAIIWGMSICIPIILAPIWRNRFTWLRDSLAPLGFLGGLFIVKAPLSLFDHKWIGIWLVWVVLENIISPPFRAFSPLRVLLNNLLIQGGRFLLIGSLYYTTILPSRPVDLGRIHADLSSFEIQTGPLFLVSGLIAMMLSIILHQTLVIYRATRLKDLGQRLENISSWSFDSHVIESAVDADCSADVGMKMTEKTIMMGDIRGFTAFCERTSPKTVVSVLEYSYAIIEDTVAGHGGAKCEFIADAFLTSFKHPERGVDCAIEISRKVNSVLSQYALGMGIGITHGAVLEGIVGGRMSKKHTLIGHTVNAAARLQGEAESGEILVTEEIVKAISKGYCFTPCGSIPLKGISHPIAVYSTKPT